MSEPTNSGLIPDEVIDRVLAATDIADLIGRHVKLRRMGSAFCGLCPFHAEKTPSFYVTPSRGTFHCFGCGAGGSVLRFVMDHDGLTFRDALKRLADAAGIRVPELEGETGRKGVEENGRCKRVERRLVVEETFLKPSLPPMRMMRTGEMETLAVGRGLSVQSVEMACERRWLGVCDWPQYENNGRWWPAGLHRPSWCITDSTRNTAEFRRIDGGKYKRADGTEIKAWSTRGKSWPIGAADMADKPWVLMVEGGPDILAALHFLNGYRMLHRVAVVGMLGASNSIRADALPFFEGKRVRIMVDADEPKDDENPRKRKMPGMEAAARWSGQLTAAGAAVETFNVGPIFAPGDVLRWGRGEIGAAEIEVMAPGYVTASGAKVKDVNDIALCNADVVDSDEIRDAFCEWKEGFGG